MNNKILRLVVVVLGIIFFSSQILAATIYGTIYDLSLEPQKNVIITLSTVPEQVLIVKDGDYEFLVDNGFYTLTAVKEEYGEYSKATENITISSNGSFRVDLILYPTFVEEKQLLANTESLGLKFDTEPEYEPNYTMLSSIIALTLGVVVLIIFFPNIRLLLKRLRRKRRLKQKRIKSDFELMDENEKKVVQLLRQNQGRLNQKELRSEFTLSEAKISLIITDLEKRKVIRKVKKGRGNIVILNTK